MAKTSGNMKTTAALTSADKGEGARAVSPARHSMILLPLAAVVVVVLAGATYSRNTLWREGVGLWEDAAAKSPEKAKVHNNLAFAYSAAGSIDKAMEQYRTALMIEPDNAAAHFNLGVIYIGRGMTDEAVAEFEAALRIDPAFPQAKRFLHFISREGQAVLMNGKEAVTR